MTENISNLVIVVLFVGLGVVAIASSLVRFMRNQKAPIRTVKAVVVGKHKTETFSKYSGNGKNEKFVVVFSVEGKKKSFYVSRFSYDGYRVNEKGMLKYKGDKLISFE